MLLDRFGRFGPGLARVAIVSLAMNETHQAAEYQAKPVFRPKPDGSIDPAGEAGWFLQRERERRGLKLEMVAHVLGIHESHLEGIESGDLVKLPSRNEALAIIGIYGKYLGFDPRPLVVHYSRILPRPIPVAGMMRGKQPRPLSSAKIIPFSAALKLAMSTRGLKIVGCIAGVGLMFGVIGAMLSPQEEQQIAVGIDPLPTATLNTEADDGSLVRVKESPMSEDLTEAQPAAEASLTPEPNQLEGGLDDLAPFINQQLGGSASDTEIPAKAKTNENIEQSLPQTRNFAGTDASARVVLKATGPVWFRVEDSRGNVIISQTLRKGDSYAVPDRDDLVIIARDGGMISYEIDGIDRGLLGTPGEIVVGRPLAVSRLIDGRG
jgi:cytoskeleton protein RodZ